MKIFTTNVTFGKEVLVKFWKSSGPGVYIRPDTDQICLSEVHWRIQDLMWGSHTFPSLSHLPFPFLASPSPSFHLPSLSLPFLPPFFFSLRSRSPLIAARGSGGALKLPNRSGRSLAAKRILVHFRHKYAHFWVPKWQRISCVCCLIKEYENYWELCIPVGPCVSLRLCRPKNFKNLKYLKYTPILYFNIIASEASEKPANLHDQPTFKNSFCSLRSGGQAPP